MDRPGFAALTWQNMVMILVGLILRFLPQACSRVNPSVTLIAGDIMANFLNMGVYSDKSCKAMKTQTHIRANGDRKPV